jgi:hypothetical protein
MVLINVGFALTGAELAGVSGAEGKIASAKK